MPESHRSQITVLFLSIMTDYKRLIIEFRTPPGIHIAKIAWRIRGSGVIVRAGGPADMNITEWNRVVTLLLEE